MENSFGVIVKYVLWRILGIVFGFVLLMFISMALLTGTNVLIGVKLFSASGVELLLTSIFVLVALTTANLHNK